MLVSLIDLFCFMLYFVQQAYKVTEYFLFELVPLVFFILLLMFLLQCLVYFGSIAIIFIIFLVLENIFPLKIELPLVNLFIKIIIIIFPVFFITYYFICFFYKFEFIFMPLIKIRMVLFGQPIVILLYFVHLCMLFYIQCLVIVYSFFVTYCSSYPLHQQSLHSIQIQTVYKLF